MADVYSIVVEFLHKGGFFIYPISLVFVIGLAIALERWVYLQYEKSRNSRAFKDFLPLLSEANIDKMRSYSRESSAPVVRVIGCGLDMMDVSRQRSDIENAMSEGMLETMPRLEQRTNYLGLLANVATLLGLLGTIIGLIGAFEAVAKADPSEKSQLLSTAISVAMNTTAVGLISAIPLLILNGLLQNKTKAIVTGIEMSAVKFLNVMTVKRHIEAGMPRPTSDGGTGGSISSPVSSDIPNSSEPATLQAKKDKSQPLAERLGEVDTESDSQTEAVQSTPDAESAEAKNELNLGVTYAHESIITNGIQVSSSDNNGQSDITIQANASDDSSVPNVSITENSIDKSKGDLASGTS